jgi:hypothetical protein
MNEYDIAVVTDLRFPGGTSSSLVEELTAAADGGYRVGVLHARSTRLGPGSVVHPRLRSLIEAGLVQLLLPGEAAHARMVVVKHPTVFAEPFAGPLPITTDSVVVVAGQVPHDDAGTYYDPEAVTANVAEALGHSPVWSPVSALVRASLGAMVLSADDWTEIIDPTQWRRTAVQTDPPTGEPTTRPLIIGRHSRPDPLKWPGDPDELRAVYPTDGSVSVRVLGGADAVAGILGEIPAAWDVLAFGAVDPAEFLSGLDAFVYFHHRDLGEAFGRTILEALAADVPAIVPRHFEATFGTACLYAEPHEVIAIARALIADPDAVAAHSATVLAHLDGRFSHAAFRMRLATLIGPPSERPSPESRCAPQLELVPPGLRASYATTLVTCLGADLDEVDALVRNLDRLRRIAPGFIPIVVHTTARSAVAAELGVETAVVMGRRRWEEQESGRWEDYAGRRIRQLAAHHRADNVVAADLLHPDAWITLQQRHSAS